MTTATPNTTEKKKGAKKAQIELAERALTKQIASLDKVPNLTDADREQLGDYLRGLKRLTADLGLVSDSTCPPAKGTPHEVVLGLGRRERTFKNVLAGGSLDADQRAAAGF